MTTLRPSTPDGHVYYVRLKTPIGVFYKLGFTKQKSVRDRFSYGGSDNAKLIDKELCMVYLADGYDVEQALHSHFAKRRAFHSTKHGFPLAGSGQSELYFVDVLGMDPDYSALKRWATSFRVLYKSCTQSIANPLLGCILFIVFGLVLVPFLLFVWLVALLSDWAEGKASQSQREPSAAVLIERLR